ncbi:hypothetical protein [Amycolatopsis sp. 195334CR]|uniref:hypothetical protein n=1 Tax=Amycolatopsis sp. 195334CR TaxID=2814588 RepID=UPI001A901E2A|nr:hypothetical protein [Amycolatopsis sp. 195334CR]MBN6036780.1 hypothetical protein [Amycolatopsis sp. 195334CR]
MTVVEKFLDRQLAEDARYGGRMDLDECPPLPPALDRHLRSRARQAGARLRAVQEIRAAGFVRLLAYAYAGMPGYRDTWQPDFTEGPLPERWREEERLARAAAEEAGMEFSWREVERQDGQGLVIDGFGRPLWETAVYPEDGFQISRNGPGRVLRELAARREFLVLSGQM